MQNSSDYVIVNNAVTREFGKLMGALAEAYGFELSAERIKLYALALADLTPDQTRDAMLEAMRECKFFPTVAEIRSCAKGTLDDQALRAYALLQRAASEFGAWRAVLIADSAAAQAFAATFGSWVEYCGLEDIAVATKRQEFYAAYRAAARAQNGSGRLFAGLTDGVSGTVGLISKGGELETIPATRAKDLLYGDRHDRPALPEARADGSDETSQGRS